MAKVTETEAVAQANDASAAEGTEMSEAVASTCKRKTRYRIRSNKRPGRLTKSFWVGAYFSITGKNDFQLRSDRRRSYLLNQFTLDCL